MDTTHKSSCPLSKTSSLPRWTQGSIETSNPIHVLSILGLLLLPDRTNIIAHNLLLMRCSKSTKAHHSLHSSQPIIFNDNLIIIILHWFLNLVLLDLNASF